mmetsp:Transcript_26446/g.55578  ORF Transcript_26446/g.55578 Transcript_26446/m.55578 type:complete len:411 (-) Transcript_26446:167-1399(-)
MRTDLRDVSHSGMEKRRCLSIPPSLCSGASDCSTAPAAGQEPNRAVGGFVGRSLCRLRVGTSDENFVQGKPFTGNDARVALRRSGNRFVPAEISADPTDGDQPLALAPIASFRKHARQEFRLGGGPGGERNEPGTLGWCRGVSTGFCVRSTVGIVDAGGRQPIRAVGLLQLSAVLLLLLEKGVHRPPGGRSPIEARRLGSHGCGCLVPPTFSKSAFRIGQQQQQQQPVFLPNHDRHHDTHIEQTTRRRGQQRYRQPFSLRGSHGLRACFGIGIRIQILVFHVRQDIVVDGERILVATGNRHAPGETPAGFFERKRQWRRSCCCCCCPVHLNFLVALGISQCSRVRQGRVGHHRRDSRDEQEPSSATNHKRDRRRGRDATKRIILRCVCSTITVLPVTGWSALVRSFVRCR